MEELAGTNWSELRSFGCLRDLGEFVAGDKTLVFDAEIEREVVRDRESLHVGDIQREITKYRRYSA